MLYGNDRLRLRVDKLEELDEVDDLELDDVLLLERDDLELDELLSL